MVINNGDQNDHKVTSVCHCITFMNSRIVLR
jgi:hypothetical protein